VTTTVIPRATTVDAALVAIDRLAPTIERRAAEVEANRRLPADLLAELAAAGCFRLLRPRSHGGLGATPLEAFRAIDALARADGSVAWTVMIGAGGWIDLAGLPRTTFDDLFGRDPDVITAGAFSPSGTATPVDGGYRVQGRWAFASGCEHADVLYGNTIEGVVDGVPQLRVAVFTPDQVVIEDTWDVAGLEGTGSHHFRVDDVVVSAERTYAPLAGTPCLDDPITRMPVPSVFSMAMATVAVGIAQGALDDVLALAADKVPLLAGGPLSTQPTFQAALATADTDVRAARALLDATMAAAWAQAVDGEPATNVDRARARAAAVWAVERAVAVVETAYRFGGGTSLYRSSPLQRRLRDVHALTQHFLVRRDTLVTAGAFLAGLDVPVLVF
jgi:alkylation response protein AidB-like acyl-CoA dehydrogenase